MELCVRAAITRPETADSERDGDKEMLSSILIVLLILLLIGEASARRPAAERPAVATAATRKRLASS
jgi:hypothetical protein